MLNQQEPLRTDHDPEGALMVHSIFPTIQGEGPFAGTPAIFIRLYGCNLQCPWCDTDYTSTKMLDAADTIANDIQQKQPKHPLVVITGGEPFRQNITPLCRKLLTKGYKVQVETNGTLYPGDDFPWSDVTVVVSPKTGKIHPETALRATAYKYVLARGQVHTDGLPKAALGHATGRRLHVARPPEGWDGPVYLQPMDAKDHHENWANLQAVVNSVLKHGRYIMGVQMHKLVDVP